MILSMYLSSVPMRFGVLLYSSKLIKTVQENGGKYPTSTVKDETKNGEDISTLVSSYIIVVIYYLSSIK